MSEIDTEARDRYYAEVSLKLSKAGFRPQPQEDGYLPVDWDDSRLCRLTANGSVQYREEHVERSGGRDALDRVINIAGTTAEYMRCMESASALHAERLGGGYTLLSEYNGIMFAAKANRQLGCEFVMWDQTKNFMAGPMIQTLSRELFVVADENGGALKNRVVLFCDELGTMPAFDILPLFSAGRSRKLTLVPIIQSLAQLEKNYGKEGAEIIIDNTQDTIFGGFAPNSQTAEALSKALGS